MLLFKSEPFLIKILHEIWVMDSVKFLEVLYLICQEINWVIAICWRKKGKNLGIWQIKTRYYKTFKNICAIILCHWQQWDSLFQNNSYLRLNQKKFEKIKIWEKITTTTVWRYWKAPRQSRNWGLDRRHKRDPKKRI